MSANVSAFLGAYLLAGATVGTFTLSVSHAADFWASCCMSLNIFMRIPYTEVHVTAIRRCTIEHRAFVPGMRPYFKFALQPSRIFQLLAVHHLLLLLFCFTRFM